MADLERRRFRWQEARLRHDRPQPDRGQAERDDRLRMRMDDGHDVRPRLVDLAMDVALAIDAAPLRLQRLTVGYAQREDVVLRDQRGRHRTWHQENVRVSRRPDRDVPEAVENVLVDQN